MTISNTKDGEDGEIYVIDITEAGIPDANTTRERSNKFDQRKKLDRMKDIRWEIFYASCNGEYCCDVRIEDEDKDYLLSLGYTIHEISTYERFLARLRGVVITHKISW